MAVIFTNALEVPTGSRFVFGSLVFATDDFRQLVLSESASGEHQVTVPASAPAKRLAP